MIRVVLLGGVVGLWASGQSGAVALSKVDGAQTFPVTTVTINPPVPLKPLESYSMTSPEISDSSEGLSVAALDQPVITYSDLLWTKEDYRAWITGTAYRTEDLTDRSAGVFPVSFLAEPAAPRNGALAQWELGERNWQYASDDGLGIRLGSTDVGTSVLAGSAKLGGVHIRQSTLAQRDDAESWSVSLAVGALDYTSDAKKGDLAYGPTAANTVIHYGLNEHVALESGVQVAPDLVTTTLGGRFDAGDWGRLRIGAGHGSLADQRGWRYQAAYDVQLMDDLHLSVRNEWDTPGFADLGHYRDGVAAGVRRQWKATIPTQRWGDISGTYESFSPVDGLARQRFGFSQQFWYSPNLRIGLQAHRELGGGDYDIGIRFSVPIN